MTTKQATIHCGHSSHIGDLRTPLYCTGGMIDGEEHSGARVVTLTQETRADDPQTWPVLHRWVSEWEGVQE